MQKNKEIKERIHVLLSSNRKVMRFIYFLIIINIVALVLESFEPIRNKYGRLFNIIEIFSIIVFTVEYLARIYTANLNKPSRRKFIFSAYGIIDLLAILPFYLPFLFTLDLRILRILRLFRFIRVLKLGRFNNSFKTIKEVFQATKHELWTTVFLAFVLLLISSTLMYYFESEVQPDKFQSIPHAFWWAISTLTTVGYGDVYPVTPIGKLLSSIIAVIGVGFVALPTGILSSAFIEKIKKDRQPNCPHCGKPLNKEKE